MTVLFYCDIHCRIEYYLDNEDLPFFEKPVGYKEYTTSKLVNILLGKNIDKSVVCSKVPMRNQRNATFIIDMENIKDSMDLRVDDNGAWLHNGLRSMWVSVCKSKVEILSRKKRPKCQLSGGAKLYCL